MHTWWYHHPSHIHMTPQPHDWWGHTTCWHIWQQPPGWAPHDLNCNLPLIIIIIIIIIIIYYYIFLLVKDVNLRHFIILLTINNFFLDFKISVFNALWSSSLIWTNYRWALNGMQRRAFSGTMAISWAYGTSQWWPCGWMEDGEEESPWTFACTGRTPQDSLFSPIRWRLILPGPWLTTSLHLRSH